MNCSSRFLVPGSWFVFQVLVPGMLVCLGVLPVPCHAQEIPPARAGLVAVPMPRLDDLEAAVAAQIRDARQLAVAAIASTSSSRELATAYGSLARVYHAYEFLDSAEPAYLNARRLASGNHEWPHLLGVLYKQTGRLDDAA